MNKYLFLLTFTLLIFTNESKSQNTDITFGIKAGANYSSYTPRLLVSGIEDVRYEGKIGFYLGGFVNFEISNNFRIQPELIFALQGSKFLNENIEVFDPNGFISTLVDFESNINESTIIIPIIAQYFINENFYLEGGPQLGYIINREEKIIKDPIKEFTGIDTEPMDFDYDKFDFGLTFGIGYKFSEKIRVNTRYFFGLLERNNNIKSSVFNLGIEYRL